MKKVTAIVTMVAVILGCAVILGDVSTSHAKSMRIPDANNKICPVTGTPLTAKKFSTIYKDTRYWFASTAATQEFKKNPEKYLRAMSAGTTPSTTSTTTTSKRRTTY